MPRGFRLKGSNVTVEDGEVGCPNCGRMARQFSGTFRPDAQATLPPAHCTNCGRDQPSGLVEASGVVVQTEDGAVGCRFCGAPARVASAMYTTDTDGRVTEVVPFSDWDADLLRRTGILVQQLLMRGLPTEEIVERVREVAPALASEIEGLPRQDLAPWAKGLVVKAARATARTAATGLVEAVIAVPVTQALAPSPERPPAVTQQVDIPPGYEQTITEDPDGTRVIRTEPGHSPPVPPGYEQTITESPDGTRTIRMKPAGPPPPVLPAHEPPGR